MHGKSTFLLNNMSRSTLKDFPKSPDSYWKGGGFQPHAMKGWIFLNFKNELETNFFGFY